MSGKNTGDRQKDTSCALEPRDDGDEGNDDDMAWLVSAVLGMVGGLTLMMIVLWAMIHVLPNAL